jgi:hypothetical protein
VIGLVLTLAVLVLFAAFAGAVLLTGALLALVRRARAPRPVVAQPARLRAS